MAHDNNNGTMFLSAVARKFGAIMTQANARGLTPVRVTVAMAEAPDQVSLEGGDDTTSTTDIDIGIGIDGMKGDTTTTSTDTTVARRVGEQVTVGGVLGLACGYTLRRIGRMAMFLVGTEVILLQYMAHRQWLVMDWGRVAADLSPTFTRSTWDKILAILVYKMPFNAAFTGGLLAGLRISRPAAK